MANLKIKLNVDDSELRRKVTDQTVRVRLQAIEPSATGAARPIPGTTTVPTPSTLLQREGALGVAAATGLGASRAVMLGTSFGVVSSSVSRYFERLSEQITKSLVTTNAFSKFEKNLFDKFPGLADTITAELKGSSAKVNLSTHLRSVLDKIEDKFKFVSDHLKKQKVEVEKIKVEDFTRAPEETTTVVANAFKKYFTSWSSGFVALESALKKFKLPLYYHSKYLTSSFLIGLPGELTQFLSKLPIRTFGKQSFIAESMRAVQFVSGAISGIGLAIRTYFESIGRMLSPILKPLKTLTTASLSAIGAAATFASTQLQSYFNYLQNLSESTRDVFGNLNIGELTTADRQAIEKILLDVSKEFGVQINELMQGVAGALPNLVEKTPSNIRWLAEIFAKLKKLENITPEQFQQLSQIAVVSGEDFEAVAQAFNILTDNVGQGAREILQQLRRLSDDMQLADLFPLIEIFSKIYASPREAIVILQSAMRGYNELISGVAEKANEDTEYLLQIMNTDLFRQTQSKYVKFSESLSDSFRQLVSATPTIEIGETFKKISEKVNQKFLELFSADKLDKLFQTVDRMIAQYFPTEMQPFAYRLYFNEQGQPTFLLSMSVLVDKVIDRVLPVLNNILKTIERMLEFVRIGTDKLQIPQTSQRIQYMQQQNPLSSVFGNLR